ncbi:MAG: DUF4115 domain-containing protein [Chloroflexi bacterium]|nr:DUF4115 domain-containing protein [Chloroflexota bacterium]
MDAADFGDFLTRARQARDLSIAEASRQTHIRPEIIAALERGEFERIRISHLQLRGMLRNYLRFLKQDPEAILSSLDQFSRIQIADSKGEKDSPQANRRQTGAMARSRSFRYSRWFAIGLLLMAFIFGSVLMMVLVLRRDDERSRAIVAELEPANVAVATEMVEEVPTPATAIAVSEVGTPAQLDLLADENLMLELSITQRGWLRILSDDVLIHEGLVRSGDEFAVTGESEIRLESGNAAGIYIQYAGEDYFDLGERGQRIEMSFRRNEIEMEWGPGWEDLSSDAEASVAFVTPSPSAEQAAAAVVATEAEPLDSPGDRSTRIITLATQTPSPAATVAVEPTATPTMASPTAVLPPRTPMALGS